MRSPSLCLDIFFMSSKYPDDSTASVSRHPRKRRQNFAVAAGLGFVALMTWLTGRSGGVACFGGACMIPEFARTGSFAPAARADRLDKNGRVKTSPLPLFDAGDETTAEDAFSRGLETGTGTPGGGE